MNETGFAQSFARLPVNQVIKCCEETAEWVAKVRKKKNRRYVREFQLRHNHRWMWLLKFVQWEPLGFKDAKKLICKRQENDLFSHYLFPTVWAGGVLGVAKDILELAKQSGDGFVYVSRDDWRKIK